MEEHSKPALIVVGVLLVGGALCFALIFLGGQTSRILSTVGSAVDVTQNGSGSGADTSGGDADEDGAGSGAGTGAGSGAAGDAGAGSATGPQVADAAATIPTLLIVRTGDLTLEVHDLDAAVRDGDSAVVRAGGYVSDSTRVTKTGEESANVTYRIPSAHWNATLEVLHGIAAKVDKEEIKTEEVTGQVVDLTARIANLRATEAALQAIMARAAKISDVLDVQRQLTTTRGEIEQLVAKKQHLEEQASFGSLAVRFHLPVVPAPAATPRPAPGWDPGSDVARATAKLVRIGQTSTSIGIWLAIVGVPLVLGGLAIALGSWQVYRLGRWLVRRREASFEA